MKTLIISHAHPDFSIGGAEVASYTLFQALNEHPDGEAYYLSKAPSSARRRHGTPFLSLGRNYLESFVHVGAWDEFWLSNDGIDDLCGPIAQYLLFINPDIVHFHHLIGIGVEMIRLVRSVLPVCRIVITFHEYLAICHNHGQMVKRSRTDLCIRSSPTDCHACFIDRTASEFYMRETVIRAHLLLVDAYVSPSEFLIDRYVDWGLPRERFSLIENGVTGSATLPRPLKIGSRRDRFAFFGQISEFKGLHILLDAVSRVSEDLWRDASLSVFGGNLEIQPDIFQEKFKALLKSAGRRVRFFGSYRQADLSSLMQDIDWVVMPSIWWENSPVVIQEAFLHKRPLIVTGIGGMSEKVAHGVNGLHFRVSSPESLTDQLSTALEDLALWDQLSSAAPLPLGPAAFAQRHMVLYDVLTETSSVQSNAHLVTLQN